MLLKVLNAVVDDPKNIALATRFLELNLQVLCAWLRQPEPLPKQVLIGATHLFNANEKEERWVILLKNVDRAVDCWLTGQRGLDWQFNSTRHAPVDVVCRWPMSRVGVLMSAETSFQVVSS